MNIILYLPIGRKTRDFRDLYPIRLGKLGSPDRPCSADYEDEKLLRLLVERALQSLTPKLQQLARHYLSDDYEDQELCDAFQISRKTLYRWKCEIRNHFEAYGLSGGSA